ncbi:hypothetical protein C806_01173 [Lachnospiraceae bacterium 3-1]|nr:hypothetical protein C806_01173 [Lachnospiraceae bacterium 3-1]
MKKRRKKHTGLFVITAFLMVTAVVLFVGRHTIVQGIKTKVATEVGKKMLEKQIGKSINVGGQEINVSDLVDQMEEQDVEKVTEIAEKYVSPENIKQAADFAASKDVEGLKNLLEGQITQEDQNELEELYYKYKDQIHNYVP